MYHRVVVHAVFGIVAHHLLHIGGQKHVHQVVNHPCYSPVEVVAGNLLEYVAQKRVGFRYQVCRLLPRETVGSVVVQSCCKHAVGHCLRIDVGKVVRRESVYQHPAEGFELALQLPVFGRCVVVFIGKGKRVVYGGCKNARLGSHLPGKSPCRCYGRRLCRCNMVNKFYKALHTVFAQAYPAAAQLGKAHISHPLAVFVEVEIEIVGEYDMVETLAIA